MVTLHRIYRESNSSNDLLSFLNTIIIESSCTSDKTVWNGFYNTNRMDNSLSVETLDETQRRIFDKNRNIYSIICKYNLSIHESDFEIDYDTFNVINLNLLVFCVKNEARKNDNTYKNIPTQPLTTQDTTPPQQLTTTQDTTPPQELTTIHKPDPDKTYKEYLTCLETYCSKIINKDIFNSFVGLFVEKYINERFSEIKFIQENIEYVYNKLDSKKKISVLLKYERLLIDLKKLLTELSNTFWENNIETKLYLFSCGKALKELNFFDEDNKFQWNQFKEKYDLVVSLYQENQETIMSHKTTKNNKQKLHNILQHLQTENIMKHNHVMCSLL